MGQTDDHQIEARAKRRLRSRKRVRVCSWAAVDADKLRDAIEGVAGSGGAIRLGYTSDGGALAIGVYGDGAPYTEYFSDVEEVSEYLTELKEAFQNNEVAPPVDRSKRR